MSSSTTPLMSLSMGCRCDVSNFLIGNGYGHTGINGAGLQPSACDCAVSTSRAGIVLSRGTGALPIIVSAGEGGRGGEEEEEDDALYRSSAKLGSLSWTGLDEQGAIWYHPAIGDVAKPCGYDEPTALQAPSCHNEVVFYCSAPAGNGFGVLRRDSPRNASTDSFWLIRASHPATLSTSQPATSVKPAGSKESGEREKRPGVHSTWKKTRPQCAKPN